MQWLKSVKQEAEQKLDELTRLSLKRRLKAQGLDPSDLPSGEFETLLKAEKEILLSDSKKVGGGIAIGLVISMLTGI